MNPQAAPEFYSAMERGTLLKGKYRLDERLGSGGMGTVWRGEDIDLKRPVAIKVLNQHAGEVSFERFLREARIAAGLQHPGITVVHDVGRDEGELFIVMELLTGSDLAAILDQNPGGLPVSRVLKLGIQVAEALWAAHEQGIVHRDLKPANLFVLAGDRVKICDFGIARAADVTSALTSTGFVLGTPAYMSPEQWEGDSIDARSDLYSLGCVLYALLAGRPPFTASQPAALMRQHLQVQPSAPRGGQAIPGPLSDLVLRLLAKTPRTRPPTAAAVAAELAQSASTPAGTSNGSWRPERVPRQSSMRTETITPCPGRAPDASPAGNANSVEDPLASSAPYASGSHACAPLSQRQADSPLGSPQPSRARDAHVHSPLSAGVLPQLAPMVGAAARGAFWLVSRLVAAGFLAQPLIFTLATAAAAQAPRFSAFNQGFVHVTVLPTVLILIIYFGSWVAWTIIAGAGGFFACLGTAFIAWLIGPFLYGHLGPIDHLGVILLGWMFHP